jgi:hypothetical protein
MNLEKILFLLFIITCQEFSIYHHATDVSPSLVMYKPALQNYPSHYDELSLRPFSLVSYIFLSAFLAMFYGA